MRLRWARVSAAPGRGAMAMWPNTSEPLVTGTTTSDWSVINASVGPCDRTLGAVQEDQPDLGRARADPGRG